MIGGTLHSRTFERASASDLAAGIVHVVQDDRQGLVDLADALRVVVATLLAVPIGRWDL